MSLFIDGAFIATILYPKISTLTNQTNLTTLINDERLSITCPCAQLETKNKLVLK